jgi:hypothetical protein
MRFSHLHAGCGPISSAISFLLRVIIDSSALLAPAAVSRGNLTPKYAYKLAIFLAVVLTGCAKVLPLCDAKDNATPWAHPEHWPGTKVEESAPVAAAQEAIEQLGCQLGI